MFEEHLVEILLTVVLMFNVGAYSFLWYKIRRVEDEVDDLDETFREMAESVTRIWKRIFGDEHDNTMEGHLVETNDRFDSIDNKLVEICEKIDHINDKWTEEHEYVQTRIDVLVDEIANSDEIDVNRSDLKVE